ncbi:MAG: pyridoxamine 5'-phosphate oxidase [Mycobacteriales bacterium]
MSDQLAAMRRDYSGPRLDVADLASDWWIQFDRWFDDARRQPAELEPNAMVLATVGTDGRPSARTVLLKGVDESGLGFFTHYTSRKGEQLAGNSAVSAVFGWRTLARQVIVDGDATRISAAESDQYFASRPYGSQIGALASRQSSVLASRRELDAAAAQQRARYPEGTAIVCPATWGGFRIAPWAVEFWQGRPDRLHDRLRYRKIGEPPEQVWHVERLAP